MRLLPVIILLGHILQTGCLYTFYESEFQNTSYYKCIKPTTNGRIILPFDYDLPFYLRNIESAQEAGLSVELIYTTQRCWAIEEEIEILATKLEGRSIDRIWIILDGQNQCDWSSFSPEQNCQYLQDYIAKAGNLGIHIQICTNKSVWINAFKSQTACPEVSGSLLWNVPDQEGQEYIQIGGWAIPYMSFQGQIQLCGQNIAINKVIKDPTTHTM